jgi:hypothetical protein
MGVRVLADFVLYQRPVESNTLLAKDVVAQVSNAGKQYQRVAIVVRDVSEGIPDKIGVFDNTKLFDNGSGKGPARLGCAAEKKAEGLQFQDHRFCATTAPHRQRDGAPGCSSLSPATWRGERGLTAMHERTRRGKGQRRVDDRPQPKEVCQARQDPANSAPVVASPPALLHLGQAQHTKGSERHSPAQGPAVAEEVRSGLQASPNVASWRTCAKADLFEIFAGSCKLTQAFLRIGQIAVALDIMLNSTDDVLIKAVEYEIISRIRRMIFRFVWLGLPCSSWSRARRNHGRGPPL